MDKQAAELKTDLNGANVERVGEGIKITFDSGILFVITSYSIHYTKLYELPRTAPATMTVLARTF